MSSRTFTLFLVLLSGGPLSLPQNIAAYKPNLGRTSPLLSHVGMEIHFGLGGAGADVGMPLSRRFNLRAGSEYFRYSTDFEDNGAQVSAHLRLQSSHASLDWFPFGGRFRVSPLVVFANNNRVQATALIPAGSTVTLNGQDYISSPADPLHGGGSVDLRKFSPGLSLGTGNMVPRPPAHFSFPVEAGFYYSGQPRLKVNFTGSACDPTAPQTGCESVERDPGFQQNLAEFIAHRNHSLSYLSFFPIFSAGVGYRF
jgi:hypothetical protein